MQIIRPWLEGRFALRDLLDVLRPTVPPLVLPEVDPSTPAPTTPFERLVLAAVELDLQVVDFRDLKRWPRKRDYDTKLYGWPKNKGRAQPYGSRRWEQLEGICLHTFDAHGMKPNRFLGVPAHCGIAFDGTPVLMHDLWRIVGHAKGINDRTAGIEVSGRSCFDTSAQVDMGRALIRYIVDERERNLDPSRHPGRMTIYGHFMATRGKPNCPGAGIMRELGEWAVDELDLLPGEPLKAGLPWQRRAAVS